MLLTLALMKNKQDMSKLSLFFFTASNQQQASVTLSSSSSSLTAGPTTPTGSVIHMDCLCMPRVGDTAGKIRQEPTVWRCGQCRKPDPPESSDGLVSRVQCDNCHKWFHTISVGWEEELDNKDHDFWCYWCLDV